jgi:3-isopropylmalate/(R)-2-methylmalate dehydratase small subunit
VSSFFADIFKNNSLNNFLLPVTVSDDFLQKIFAITDKNPAEELEVNLQEQYIKIVSTGEQEHFDINNYKKTCLLNGYDDIDYLLSMKDDIARYETEKAF